VLKTSRTLPLLLARVGTLLASNTTERPKSDNFHHKWAPPWVNHSAGIKHYQGVHIANYYRMPAIMALLFAMADHITSKIASCHQSDIIMEN
jgi:hypothetical protein